jgi:SAM-dependent methyltransferase
MKIMNTDDHLCFLKKVYPKIIKEVENKAICDFGCGSGDQVIALRDAGARVVWGVDTNHKRVEECIRKSEGQEGIHFSNSIELEHKGIFDLVISQNSMEHYPDPYKTLMEMKSLLKPQGNLLITFGPPWYSHNGAHMAFFTKIPWVHLIFPEKWIMAWRKKYRSDGAMRYEEVESGLNKMSILKFERLIKEGGMKVVYQKYHGLKNIDFLTRIPILRELFINHVTIMLENKPQVTI